MPAGSLTLAPPPLLCSLAQLLAESSTGAETAFADLHLRTRARLHATVLRVVRSPELAREVTQEVYLEIWQQAGRYSPDRGTALAWMLMIARRRAVDRVRAVNRTSELEHRVSLARPGWTDDHADQVVRRLDAARVHPLLDCLSPLQRQAVTMVYLERRTLQEAATVLEVPLGTLKTRVRDALLRLRRRVRGTEADAPPTPPLLVRASGCA
jgi:RNA polymerase sigma-70 factor (ECF subfamily)